MANVVCLCVDGSAGKGRIKEAVVSALGWCAIGLVPGQMKYSKSAAVPVRRYRSKVEDLIERNGSDPSALGLLLVGKSLGGAKLYRFMHDYAEYLKRFAALAGVLVDAHAPNPVGPGNEGDTGEWYKYVHLSGGDHHLTWWEDKWGPHGDQREPDARLRLYATYQRNSYPRGYRLNTAFENKNLTGKSVRIPPENELQTASHWNISNCHSTVYLLMDAVKYLQAAEPL